MIEDTKQLTDEQKKTIDYIENAPRISAGRIEQLIRDDCPVVRVTAFKRLLLTIGLTTEQKQLAMLDKSQEVREFCMCCNHFLDDEDDELDEQRADDQREYYATIEQERQLDMEKAYRRSRGTE